MQSSDDWAHPTRPAHPYYRHLYGNFDEHLDVALACAVIFDEIILPAADARYPDSVMSPDYRTVEIPGLGLFADWDPVRASREAMTGIAEDVARDARISHILKNVPKRLRTQVVVDVATDMLLLGEYKAPVISSPGRRAMLLRLIELDVLADLGLSLGGVGSIQKSATESPATLGAVTELRKYVSVTGLTFKSPDVKSLSGIKSNSLVRNYAGNFQKVLTADNSDTGPLDLFESIRSAWKSRVLQSRISGSFTATSRGLSVLGLIPGVGTVAEVVAMGAEATAIASEKLERKNSWYEIGPEILRLESLAALERHLEDADTRD
ncbi:hypothetical protein [Streptomyces sp. NPDC088350]|uniref:hypothetical protein n=1 Tax=Streptomyces sp. NPDC088350 TaxID=3365854 RepID=UPI0038215419